MATGRDNLDGTLNESSNDVASPKSPEGEQQDWKTHDADPDPPDETKPESEQGDRTDLRNPSAPHTSGQPTVTVVYREIDMAPATLDEDEERLIVVETDDTHDSDEQPAVDTRTTIGAPILVAGEARISLLVDEAGVTSWFAAPFHIAGLTSKSVIENGGTMNKLGRFPGLRTSPAFVASANQERGASRALADLILRGKEGDGYESIRNILVHPNGPLEGPIVFTRGNRQNFDILVNSILARFAEKKTEATAYGQQSNAIGKSFVRIELGNGQRLELAKSLCDIIAKEYDFHGVKWTQNEPAKVNEHHILQNWKPGVPTIVYERGKTREGDIDMAELESWCSSRGIVVERNGP